jgi:short-subunit dehydrogenase
MSARLALVTGASAGLGTAFAQVYAAHGYDLAITARREARLEDLADKLRLHHGCTVLVIPADLAAVDGPERILGRIAEQGRHVDAVVNNAGYGEAAPFGSQAWTAEAAFIRVMFTAVCEMTHRVLPGMKDRRFGRIVNVASLAGILPGSPNAALYGAVKAGLIAFSQGLHLETRDAGVHVSALCPGLTYSEFHDVNHSRAEMAARVPPWVWMGADEAAAAGYEAAEANRPVCVPGAPNKAAAFLAKLLPDEWLMALMARGTRAGRGGAPGR